MFVGFWTLFRRTWFIDDFCEDWRAHPFIFLVHIHSFIPHDTAVYLHSAAPLNLYDPASSVIRLIPSWDISRTKRLHSLKFLPSADWSSTNISLDNHCSTALPRSSLLLTAYPQWPASATPPSGNASPSPCTWTKRKARGIHRTRIPRTCPCPILPFLPSPNTDNSHSDSWLYRETSKTRSRRFICPIFWLAFFVLVPTVTAVMIWLAHEGYFNALKPSGSTPATQADPNSGVTGS